MNLTYDFYGSKNMLIKICYGGYIGDSLVKLEIPLNMDKEYYHRLSKLLRISPVKNKLCRIGRHGDGGYIMPDVFRDGGIAYSFGINDDVSWDEDMAKRGYDVYMYDHTIETLPYERPEFHFHKCGIASKEIVSPTMKTLENLLHNNCHMNVNNMILKMDVEGAEWEVLASVNENILARFDQIVLEYHGLLEVDEKKDKVISLALSKINSTHKLIHLHGNNYGTSVCLADRVFPNVLEATYVRKGLPSIIWSNEEVELPLDIDEPNDPYRPDLILGKWNYDWE